MTPTPVLLVSVPFAPLGSPSIGLSLLQACLDERGIASTIVHLGLDFAVETGVSEYRFIVDELLFTPDLTGDFIFAGALHDSPADDEAWFDDILDGGHPAHRKPLALRIRDRERTRARIRALRAEAPRFLDRAAAQLVAAGPRVVGLTSVFAQNAAALALAKRIKALDPSILVCLGGANAEGTMGEALFEHFPQLDVVVSGEGELRFPLIVEAHLAGRPLPRLSGVWSRAAVTAPGPVVEPGPADLATLPPPRFDDFFAQLRETGLRLRVELPFETSRGCWWGQKHHCTFCGLNGETMAFRRKPAERALAELAALRARHPGRSIMVVDNILDMTYFRDFLPALAALPDPPRLFYEVKANLTRAQLRLLKAAGVTRIQPGIESLSDDVLRRMKKGLRALQGIQLLRDCARIGIDVSWNVLAGFPGEDAADYVRMAAIVPLLTHLDAPGVCSTIRLDRFSPLHTQAEVSGLVDVHAYPAYAHVYRLAPEVLDRIAYYFSFRYADGRDVAQYLAPLAEAVDRWTAQRGRLAAEIDGDDVVVIDQRDCAVSTRHVLRGAMAWVLRACDEVRTTAALAEAGGLDPDTLAGALGALRESKLLLTDGESHLSLPLFDIAAGDVARRDVAADLQVRMTT